MDVCKLSVSQQCAAGDGMFPLFLCCHSHGHLPANSDGVITVGFLGEEIPMPFL